MTGKAWIKRKFVPDAWNWQKFAVPKSYKDKLTHLWYVIFSLYGICINGETQPVATTKFFKCRFVAFAILQTVSNCVAVVAAGFVSSQSVTVSSISMVLITPTMSIIGTSAAIIFVKRQQKLSSLFQKLLTHTANHNSLAKIWKSLLITLMIITIHAVITYYYTTQMVNYFAFEFKRNLTNDDGSENYRNILSAYEPLFKSFVFLHGGFCFFYSYFYNAMTIMFCITSCQLLTLNFKIVNELVTKIIVNKQLISSEAQKEIQTRHQLICQWTEELSSTFAPLLAFWSGGEIIALCFFIRGAKFEPPLNASTLIVTYVLYLLREVYFLYVFHKNAAVAHEQAEISASNIGKIPLENDTKEDAQPDLVQNINRLTFLQQYSTKPVGISVSGYYIISHGSMLSLLGTLITYVIILYQTSM